MASPPVIDYDYDFSPYGQKIRMMLALAGIPHKRCDVPIVLPRPQLESLGVKFRRIPVLAVGKDVYCDTSLITRKILELQGPDGKLHEHPASPAFESYGDTVFQTCLTLIPPQLLSQEFVTDRKSIFPILTRPDFDQLRPSGLGAFASILKTIEDDFLASGYPYIGGRKEPSTADVHVGWAVRWACTKLGVENEPGLGAESFPRTYAWFRSLPDIQPEALDAEASKEAILKSDDSKQTMQTRPDDPLNGFVNKQVNVESSDAVPGAHPQPGKLVGTSILGFVVELDNGIRLHFPRAGYYVKPR